VGLPPGQAGNSEAGHSNLGAGRLVLQDSVIISNGIKDGHRFRVLIEIDEPVCWEDYVKCKTELLNYLDLEYTNKRDKNNNVSFRKRHEIDKIRL
jgi:hypothetical protein